MINGSSINIRYLIIVSIFGLSAPSTFASTQETATQIQEPAYCEPTTFMSREITSEIKSKSASAKQKPPERFHAFRIGDAVIAGMAVGNSDPEDVKSIAAQCGKTGATPGEEVKYCTWYVNKDNEKAEKAFNHQYLGDPRKAKAKTDMVEEYLGKVGPMFKKNAANFVDCISKYGYFAVGCNGQKHRGPTVFGMLLAASGCTPEHSAEIVNTLWGLNDIKPEVRLEVIKAAAVFGAENSDIRRDLHAVFSK